MASNFVSLPQVRQADISAWRKYDDGTTPVAYYLSPSDTNLSAFGPWPTGRITATPFPSPSANIIKTISIEVTTAAGTGSKIRMAIYTNTNNVYPFALLADCGEVAADTLGLKTITGLNIALQQGQLYWICSNQNITSGALSLRVTTASNGIVDILGFSPSSDAGFGRIDVTQTYGPYPTAFPLGGTLTVGGMPAKYLTFSA